jgi:hypothetical protein
MSTIFFCSFYFYIYLHVYTLFGAPPPPLTVLPDSGRTCSALLFSDFVEEKTWVIIRKT